MGKYEWFCGVVKICPSGLKVTRSGVSTALPTKAPYAIASIMCLEIKQ